MTYKSYQNMYLSNKIVREPIKRTHVVLQINLDFVVSGIYETINVINVDITTSNTKDKILFHLSVLGSHISLLSFSLSFEIFSQIDIKRRWATWEYIGVENDGIGGESHSVLFV